MSQDEVSMVGLWKSIPSFKKGKLFAWFFVSYTLVLIIPLGIISFIVYGNLMGILKEDTIKANVTIINQARDTIDMNFRQLDQIFYELSNNPKIIEFTSNRATNVVETNTRLKSIIKDINMSSINVAKSFTDAIFIYSLKNDLIISNATKYEPELFYSTFINDSTVPYPLWMSQVKSVARGQFFPSTHTMGKAENKVITYLQPLNQYGMNDNAVLIALLSEDRIWNLFGDGEYVSQSYRAILDRDYRVVSSAPGSMGTIPWDYDEIFRSGRDHVYLDHNGERYIAIYTDSHVYGLKYITILPETVLMEKISSLHVLFSVVIVVCILIGITLSYIFSVRNYKPVIRTLQWLMSNRKGQAVTHKSEYETILSNIKGMHSENHLLESRLHKQLPVLKDHFLLRLMKNNMIDLSEMNELMEFYNIRFPYDGYTVAVIHIEDIRGFVSKMSFAGKSRARFVVCNIGEEVIRNRFYGFAVEIEEDQVALLINSGSDPREGNEQAVDTLLGQLKDYLNTKFNIVIGIGVGNSYSGLKMVHESYQEAMTALNYGLIRGRNTIHHFGHIRSSPNQFSYPPDKENQLIVSVKTGDRATVDSLLDRLYHINFEERKLSPEMVNCLYHSMINTGLRILEELQLDYGDLFDEDTDLFQQINHSKSVEANLAAIRELFGRICTIIEEKKAKSNDKLREELLQYILERYSDKDLSLGKAAADYSMSPPYLSTLFKLQTGYNFSDYVNRIRVQQSKALLADERVSIQDIADRVGYNSANTFIRIFRKYESVTPGQYRESLRAVPASPVAGAEYR